MGEEYRSFSSSLCNLLHSLVTSSLLGPNILLNTIFSNTLSFLSSRNVSDQVSHPSAANSTAKYEIVREGRRGILSHIAVKYSLRRCRWDKKN
jgi:hypothetical protein